MNINEYNRIFCESTDDFAKIGLSDNDDKKDDDMGMDLLKFTKFLDVEFLDRDFFSDDPSNDFDINVMTRLSVLGRSNVESIGKINWKNRIYQLMFKYEGMVYVITPGKMEENIDTIKHLNQLGIDNWCVLANPGDKKSNVDLLLEWDHTSKQEMPRMDEVFGDFILEWTNGSYRPTEESHEATLENPIEVEPMQIYQCFDRWLGEKYFNVNKNIKNNEENLIVNNE